MRSAEFWQGLLSLDLPPTKARAVLERLGPQCSTFEQLSSAAQLTAREKELIAGGAVESKRLTGINFVSLDDSLFPEDLRTANPPVVLAVRGTLPPADSLSVAIVGTRKASVYGKAVAKKIASELAACGITIVSGGAYGIDAAAHQGALEAGGRTVAVMGCGVDEPYPRSNRDLFNRIIENGALVSQFALGTSPDWWRFPVRNDTIVGLCRAVVVVEAPEKSGALTTASSTAEHGRHMFVTPASIDSVSHRGSFKLINDGATLLYSPDQIFEALGIEKRLGIQQQGTLTDVQQKILHLLTIEPEIADNLAERLEMPPGPLLGELTVLEVLGYITKTPGGYIRN